MVDPALIIEELNKAGVDYVVIGGVAATLYGCPEQTYDLDILYASTPKNRAKLLAALHAIDAEWDRPLDEKILQLQSVFALNTKHGDLDIFTTIPGLESYEDAASTAQLLTLGNSSVRVLNLSTLIATKETAADANPRKQSALIFLKALRAKQSGW